VAGPHAHRRVLRLPDHEHAHGGLRYRARGHAGAGRHGARRGQPGEPRRSPGDGLALTASPRDPPASSGPLAPPTCSRGRPSARSMAG
jgi:hypothetical protein